MSQEEANKPPTSCPYLKCSDIEYITDKSSDKAVKKMNDFFLMEIGRSVINKFIWLVGAVTVGLALWLHSKGFL